MIKEPGAVEPWSHGLRDMKKMYVMISIKKRTRSRGAMVPRFKGMKKMYVMISIKKRIRSRGAMVPR